MNFSQGLVLGVLLVLLILVIALAGRREPGMAPVVRDAGEEPPGGSLPEEDSLRSLRRALGRLEVDRERARRGGARRPARERAADHFRAATLFRRAAADGESPPPETRRQARQHYLDAVRLLSRGGGREDEATRARDRAAGRRREPAEPGAEFMLDAVMDFAYGGLGMILEGFGPDPLGFHDDGNFGFDGGANILWGPFVPGPTFFDAELVGTTAEARAETVRERRQIARDATGGARGAAAETFLDLSERHTDDPENSHDPAVLAGERAIIGRLREEQGAVDSLPGLPAIDREIQREGPMLSRDPAGHPRPDRVGIARLALQRAANGETAIALTVSDEEVIRRVWARAGDSGNSQNAAKMRQAFFDALVDCAKHRPTLAPSDLTCVNGRISRVLGSLALLDRDPRNWELTKLEQYKNEMFEEAKAIIRRAAQGAADSDNPELQRVGRSYLAQTSAEAQAIGEVDEGLDEAFVRETREKVSRALDAHAEKVNRRTDGAIPPHALASIKEEAAAALG